MRIFKIYKKHPNKLYKLKIKKNYSIMFSSQPHNIHYIINKKSIPNFLVLNNFNSTVDYMNIILVVLYQHL